MDKQKVAVIGAGAAGLFFAANAKNVDVTIFDHMPEVGKKLLLTGGGRCNLTNLREPEDFLQNVPCGNKFLQSAINGFSPQNLCDWFLERGVGIKREGKRVFPASESAKDVRAFFVSLCKKNGAKFVTGKEVLVYKKEDKFVVDGKLFDVVVLATGGKSFSQTGSDGSGNLIAKNLGLEVCEFLPKLSPVFAKGTKELQGISFDTNVCLEADQKIVSTACGGVLFTHFGLSGHAILNLSNSVTDKNKKLAVVVDLCPKYTEEELLKEISTKKEQSPKKHILSVVCEFVQKRIAQFVLQSLFVQNKNIADIRNVSILEIVQKLKSFKFSVDKFGGFDLAYVSSGGVLTKEINPKTMESKTQKNVYVIGEALDVFGLCGGFNLQIAFSTAFAAAKAIQLGVLPN